MYGFSTTVTQRNCSQTIDDTIDTGNSNDAAKTGNILFVKQQQSGSKVHWQIWGFQSWRRRAICVNER